MAARPSGVAAIPSGAAAESGDTAADLEAAKDPVTAPAQAGCAAVDRPSASPIERRPFARSTACPTWAAKPSAIRTVPSGKRTVATMFMSAATAIGGNELRGGGAARGRSVRSNDHRAWLDLQLETAVAAGGDHGLADDLALRTADQQVRLVDVAALRPERVDQAVAWA